MPHKRAKNSAREEQRKQQYVYTSNFSASLDIEIALNERGANHAPGKESISNEAIPKSAARVLNALKTREDYRRKRKLEQDGNDNNNGRKRQRTEDVQLKIKPGEPIQHFYRRVEDDMRPVVRSAIQSSKAVERRTRKTLTGPGKKQPTEGSSETARSVTDRRPQALSPAVAAAGLGPEPKGPNSNNPTQRPKEFTQLSSSTPRRLNDITQGPPEIKKVPRGAKHTNVRGKREGILSMAQKSMMEQEREKVIARYRMLKASRIPTAETE